MSTHTSSDSSSVFEWDEYLAKTGGRPADPKCFKQSRIPPKNLFEVNALLEAEDQRSAAHDVQTTSPFTPDGFKSSATGPAGIAPGFNRRSSLTTNPVGTLRRFRAAAFSLAQVIEVWGPRLRIRLIGTDDRNDCWFLVDSDQIRPYPSGEPLQPPFGYMYNHLNWSRTLKNATEGAKFADPSWFIESPPDPTDNFFRVGDKLEAVDRHNSQLICPATVGAVNGQHIFVSFDGWSGAFDYWTRFDSRELFPVGWCKLADYPLQTPGPNALRSPTSQSTPAPTRPPTSGHSFHPSPLEMPSLTESPGPPKFVKRTVRMKHLEKKSRSRVDRRESRPGNRRRTKSSTIKRSRLVRTVQKPAEVLNRNIHISSSAWPSAVVRKLSSEVPSPQLELADSANSSMRSMSSPPIIHPMTEDASESLLNLSGSSSDQPPPPIEVALPIHSDPPRVRRISNSSDCVVRLQAKSPPVPSDRVDYTKPEHKSWQVVPIIPQPQKKALKRHRHSVDKTSRLRKKFKIVGTSERSTVVTTKGEFDQHSASNVGVAGLNQDVHLEKPKSIASTKDEGSTETIFPQKSNTPPPPQQPYSAQLRSDRSGQTPLHLYCGEYNTAGLAPYESKPVNYLPNQSGSVSSGEQLDEEVASSVTRSNGMGQSYATGLWYPPSRMDYPGSKLLDTHAASSQATDDYSDGQSLAPHVSSSTVSPSSLDLGPGPLPNPSLWTIDEVYHYLTTRDPSLLEVAQKFKHHEIDGQALLLLNMESLRNYLQVKLGPALKVDHMISRIKRGLL